MTTQETFIQLTQHGQKRLDQRGISLRAIEQVMQQGKVIHKQKLKFIYLPRTKVKALPLSQQRAVSNLVVITNTEMDTLITCYKNERAVHKIHKKSKRKIKYAA